MNDLTPEQRARALELYRLHFLTLTGVESKITDAGNLTPSSVKAWLAAEAHVLASHTCPDPESYSRVKAWNAIAQHPLFADCYQTEGTLIDAMVAKLDAAQNHTCEPVRRPTTADEIQAGWEVRARQYGGMEVTWGVAHRQADHGGWVTEAGARLTYDAPGWNWTYETTAPLPEPEPWPEGLVRAAVAVMADAEAESDDREDEARAVLNLLAAKFPGVRAAITGGEQS